MDKNQIIQNHIKETANLTTEELIQYTIRTFQDRVVFASSLGEEDQVILDMIARVAPQIKVFTLDTGRLFQETYELMEKNKKKYKVPLHIYYPNTIAVEKMVNEKGINLFYDSVENRKLCCHIRKIEPLKRALSGHEAWICGLRKSQSVTRTNVDTFEWDEANQIIKINPLAHWSYHDVKEYIEQHAVDINPLHDQGFLSIGCASCTRAVKEGGDIRSGRWWWEQPEQKECGLHGNPNRPPLDGYKNEGQNI